MSSAGGLGGFLAGLVSGAQTILGQLAAAFRLGQWGAVQPPITAQPGRERLTTPQQIVDAAHAAGLVPQGAGAATESEGYICVFTLRSTGEVIARVRKQIDYAPGTARSTRYSQARRLATQEVKSGTTSPPMVYDPDELDWSDIQTSCRRLRGGELSF